MGGFDPFLVMNNRGALPQAPQMPGPRPGGQGGMMGMGGGMNPYAPMPYQMGAGETLALGIGELAKNVVGIKQAQQKKTDEEFKTQLELMQSGLLVNPDYEKLGKLWKKSSYGKYADFENPAPPPMPSPQQQQEQQINSMLISPNHAPQGMIGGGMPMGANVSFPQQQGPPPQPQQQGPGMMQRMGNAMGFGLPQVGAQSPAVQQLQQMGEQMKTVRQMQQGGAMAEFQNKMGEAQVKQRVLQLTLAAMGTGPDGKPLPPQAQQQARFLLQQGNMAQKFDSDDLTHILNAAEGAGAGPEQRSEFTRAWLQQKTGYNEYTKVVNDTAKILIDNGVSPDKAFTNAFSVAAGKGVIDLPKFNVETLQKYFGNAVKLREQYPTAKPEVWAAVDPYVWTGDTATAVKVLGKQGGSTAPALKEKREAAQLGISQGQLAVSQGQLGVAQQNAGTAARNAATSEGQLAETQKQHKYSNLMQALGMNLQMLKDGGLKPGPETMKTTLQLMSNVMPGMFRIADSGVDAPGLGTGNMPMMAPPPGLQFDTPEAQSKMVKWMVDDFYPVFMQATGFSPVTIDTPGGRTYDLPQNDNRVP